MKINKQQRAKSKKNVETTEDAAAFAQAVEQMTRMMEKTRIAEYVEYLERPWKLLWINFLIGIARGLGSTIGLAIVLGTLVYVLQKVIMLNLPVLSDVITKVVQMVLDNLQYFNGHV